MKDVETKEKLSAEEKKLSAEEKKLIDQKYDLLCVSDQADLYGLQMYLGEMTREKFCEESRDSNFHLFRLQANRFFGFREEAKKDAYSLIRLEAYQSLGWEQEALSDEDDLIRESAQKYFDTLNVSK